jgi:DsbC/DsbD-like thiol-disulfide interchange protein
MKRMTVIAAITLAVISPVTAKPQAVKKTTSPIVATQAPHRVISAILMAPANVVRGKSALLLVSITIQPHYHINSAKPNDKSLIPTSYVPTIQSGVTFGTPKYPVAKMITLPYTKTPLAVYTGTTVIKVPFTVAKSVKKGRLVLNGSVNYQACNEKACFPPDGVGLNTVIEVK